MTVCGFRVRRRDRVERSSRLAPAERATSQSFRRLLERGPQIRGTLVPDARLAALAISHGARPDSADRGFRRFDGLDHFDPAG